MPGGYRAGAGRPRKTDPASSSTSIDTIDPVSYLRAVMRDPDADPARRDRAAIALLPYSHRRVADMNKKELAALAAATAASGRLAPGPAPHAAGAPDWDALLGPRRDDH